MELLKDYTITIVDAGLKPAVLELLSKNDLPTADLDEGKVLYACLANGHVIATGGLEFLKDCALLRSISIRSDLQKKGLGRLMISELENVARQRGIVRLYLLTTTAEHFFHKNGYTTIDRKEAPGDIQHTTQFSSVCCSTAKLMIKFLS